MSEEKNQFSDFMQKGTFEQGPDGTFTIFNNPDAHKKQEEKEKTALEVKEEEDKKELDEAKKESKANASKYAGAQANLVAAQTRRVLIMAPFIICAILLLILVATKGGDWIQSFTQFGLNKLRGG